MRSLWVVEATSSTRSPTGGTVIEQLPSFMLDGDKLGIVSRDHAEHIALRVLAGYLDRGSITLNVYQDPT